MERLDVHEYFELPETVRPMELVYGVVREPAMPDYAHQRTATRFLALLYMHVERQGSGDVLSPMDVVLDEAAALVVQPDLVFVTRERRGIIKDRIGGHRIWSSKSCHRTRKDDTARQKSPGTGSMASVNAG